MIVSLPEYCDSCPYIDIVSDTVFADGKTPVVIKIQCRNHAICERMAEYMSQGATTDEPDEPQDDTDETGYNPYMGCYDFDC